MFKKILNANRGEIAWQTKRRHRHLPIAAAAALLSTANCAQATAEQSEPARTRIVAPTAVRITTMPLGQALSAFRSACFETFPDPATFNRAVANLGMGFERTATEVPGRQQWREGERYFVLDTIAGEQDCSFYVAIQEQLARAELLERIGRSLAPNHQMTDREFMAFWALGDSGCRIDYLPASDDLRLFTIMLRGNGDGRGC